MRKTHTIGEASRRTAEVIYHQFCSSTVEDRSRLSDLAEWTREMSKSDKTLEREQYALSKLIELLGDIPITSLSITKMDAYKKMRLEEVKPATINVDIRVLNMALRQAVANGHLIEAPGPFRLLNVPE